MSASAAGVVSSGESAVVSASAAGVVSSGESGGSVGGMRGTSHRAHVAHPITGGHTSIDEITICRPARPAMRGTRYASHSWQMVLCPAASGWGALRKPG